jgi:hypothetical protein
MGLAAAVKFLKWTYWVSAGNGLELKQTKSFFTPPLSLFSSGLEHRFKKYLGIETPAKKGF